MQIAVPYMQIRGGSSKGLYFHAADLPGDEAERDAFLLGVMGGSDPRQIDGLGGADPLTSKVAIVSRSERGGADIDYLFAQVVVGEDRIDTTPTCGNILAGVGPFAIESGLVKAQTPVTKIRVHLVNSGSLCELQICTPNGHVEYQGDTSIDGVPGSSAPMLCDYLDPAGSICGSLFPTGNLIDSVDGIELTCIDNGMPVVLLRAADFGLSGAETPAKLNLNESLKYRLKAIRLQIGPKMNLGNVDGAAVPKMCLIAPASRGGLISTRTFIPYTCHSAIGVLGAVSVATACVTQGTIAAEIATSPTAKTKLFSVEHPAGELSIRFEMEDVSGAPVITRAGLVRTARLLSRGECYLPSPQAITAKGQ